MFNWKKIFNKSIDPKTIPVLEDVIDETKETVEDYPQLLSNDNNDSSSHDDFIIDLTDEFESGEFESDKVENKDDNDVIIPLSSSTNQSNEADTDDSEKNNPDDDDSNIVEIRYSDTKTSEISESGTDTESDSETNSETDSANESTPNTATDEELDLTTAVDIDTIVNKVVEQLMPELEQHLHTIVKQALSDKLAEEIADATNNLDDEDSSKKN